MNITLNQRGEMLRGLLKNRWIRANFVLDEKFNEDYWYDCTNVTMKQYKYFWAILPNVEKLRHFLISIGLQPTSV